MPKVGTVAEGGSNLAVAVDTKIADSYTTPNTDDHIYTRVFVLGAGSSATCYLKFGVYTDNAGAPNALVANSTVTLPVFTATKGWRSATFATPFTLTKNVKYHLAVLSGDGAGESVILRQANGAANQESDAVADTYAVGLADPWGGAGTQSAKTCTMYIRSRSWPATLGKRWRK